LKNCLSWTVMFFELLLCSLKNFPLLPCNMKSLFETFYVHCIILFRKKNYMKFSTVLTTIWSVHVYIIKFSR
jgi:hypothetical protein